MRAQPIHASSNKKKQPKRIYGIMAHMIPLGRVLAVYLIKLLQLIALD